MSTAITISASDFRDLHNALCDTRSVRDRASGVVSDQLWNSLDHAIEQMERALQDAYAQENDDFTRKSDHYSAVADQLKLDSIWSMYEVEDLNQPHPFPDSLQVCYASHWGPKPVYTAITGLTWADLYRAADQAITQSGDHHHVFIEDFVPNKQEPRQLILATGS